jgi:catalase
MDYDSVPHDDARATQVLFENTARAMGDAILEVNQRHGEHGRRADPRYGAGVAAALGLEHAALPA